MEKRALGRTGIEIAPVVLGGNVFCWTIDEKASTNVLDAFIDHVLSVEQPCGSLKISKASNQSIE
jgi:aryl-alcohol dehydrogenase-like predicted oxidoreductase